MTKKQKTYSLKKQKKIRKAMRKKRMQLKIGRGWV